MPDFDAYAYFNPKKNVKEDFKKSIDWIAQQEKQLNDKQRIQFEKLISKQTKKLKTLAEVSKQNEYKKKRQQPKQRLVPESHQVKTSKKKIEVIVIRGAGNDRDVIKKKHVEQVTEFLKTAEVFRQKENSKTTVADRGITKAFKPVARNRVGRGIDKSRDRGEGR